MAPHSSALAWRIPRTEEPGRLQSMGSQESGHDLETKPPPPLQLLNRAREYTIFSNHPIPMGGAGKQDGGFLLFILLA